MIPRFIKKKTRRPEKKVDGGAFIKYGISDFFNELEKSNSLYSVSATTPLFNTPKVISFDQGEQSISYEFFNNLQSIQNTYLNYLTSKKPSDSDFILLTKTGAALAKIHNGLSIKNEVRWKPGALFEKSFYKKTKRTVAEAMESVTWTIAHCDYGFSNLQTIKNSEGSQDLVVIDPSPNEFTTWQANLKAPILLDLSNLVSCIYGLVPLRNYGSMYWSRVSRLKESIINAYIDASGYRVDRLLLDGMVHATAKCYLNSAYKKPFSTIGYWLLFTNLKKIKTK